MTAGKKSKHTADLTKSIMSTLYSNTAIYISKRCYTYIGHIRTDRKIHDHRKNPNSFLPPYYTHSKKSKHTAALTDSIQYWDLHWTVILCYTE